MKDILSLYNLVESITTTTIWDRRNIFSKVSPTGKIISYKFDKKLRVYKFQMLSSSGKTAYLIELDPEECSVYCNCESFNQVPACKHIAGAIEYLKNETENIQNLTLNNTELLKPKIQNTDPNTVVWNILPPDNFDYNYYSSKKNNLFTNEFKLIPHKIPRNKQGIYKINDAGSLVFERLLNRYENGQVPYLDSNDIETVSNYIIKGYSNAYINIMKLPDLLDSHLNKESKLYYNNKLLSMVVDNCVLKLQVRDEKNECALELIIQDQFGKIIYSVNNTDLGKIKISYCNRHLTYIFIEEKNSASCYIITQSIDLESIDFVNVSAKNHKHKDLFQYINTNSLTSSTNFQTECLAYQKHQHQFGIYLSQNNDKLIVLHQLITKEDYQINTIIDKDGSFYLSTVSKQEEYIAEKALSDLYNALGIKYFREIEYTGAEIKNYILNCLPQLKENNIKIFGLDKLKSFNYKRANIKVNINTSTNWFDVELGIEYEGKTLDSQTTLKLLKRNLNYVELGKDILYFEDEILTKFKNLIALSRESKENLKLSRFHSQFLEVFDNKLLIDEESKNRLITMSKNNKNITKIKNIPNPNLSVELRDYQKIGYNWLYSLYKNQLGGVLADEMGLGKTLQCIALLSIIDKKKANLVVVPTSLLYNWKAEIEKFCPELDVYVHYGTGRSSVVSKSGVILTTYGILQNDFDEFNKLNFEVIILDEGHNIKNSTSNNFKSVSLLNGKCRLCLTGTPIENSLLDLWSLMDFAIPSLLGDVNLFKKNFVNEADQESNSLLKNLTSPFILRRVKIDVAKELGDKVENFVYVEMNEQQKILYESTRALFLENLNNDENKNQLQVIDGILKLRQIANDPSLITKDFSINSPKIDMVISKLEEVLANNQKVLIFSQFTSILAIIKERLNTQKIDYLYLDGKTKNRIELVNQFQTEDKNKVFLISLKAGGVGLNLTSAENVFIVDPWWNPQAENQAIDRTHRIGQSNTVFVYKFITKDSIEEKILDLQKTKLTIVENVLNIDKGVKKINIKDIVNLI